MRGMRSSDMSVLDGGRPRTVLDRFWTGGGQCSDRFGQGVDIMQITYQKQVKCITGSEGVPCVWTCPGGRLRMRIGARFAGALRDWGIGAGGAGGAGGAVGVGGRGQESGGRSRVLHLSPSSLLYWRGWLGRLGRLYKGSWMIHRFRCIVAPVRHRFQRLHRRRPTLVAAVGAGLITFGILFTASCATSGGLDTPRQSATSGALAAEYRQEPDVRVRIGRGVASARIEASGGVLVSAAGRRSNSVRFDFGVIVSRDDAGFVLHGVRRDKSLRWDVPALEVRSAARSVMDYAGGTYPHELRTVATSGRVFDVVNVAPMEQYLPGVLTGELYGHWHPEAFAAQAIAARSYAIANMADAAGRHYDVESTTASQVYTGHTRNSKAVHAVEAAGRVRTVTWRSRSSATCRRCADAGMASGRRRARIMRGARWIAMRRRCRGASLRTVAARRRRWGMCRRSRRWRRRSGTGRVGR